MDLIIVGRRRDHTFRVNLHLTPWRAGIVVGVACALLLGGGIALGQRLAGQPEGAARVADLGVIWTRDMAAQREELRALRAELQAQTHALARRIAMLDAQMMRLDAAGKRLTEVADLDAGEFDFDAVPPVGGPEAISDDGELPTLTDLHAALSEHERRLADRERQMRVLEDLLLASRIEQQARPSGWPVSGGWISSRYGPRTDPFTGRRAIHYGMDFAGREGADVLAVGSGVVTYAGYRYGYGKLVEINHGNGYVTRYGHNRKVRVAVGDRVTKGQVIAEMGSTGRSTGPHVHFEVLRNGRAVDPAEYIRASR